MLKSLLFDITNYCGILTRDFDRNKTLEKEKKQLKQK